MNARIVKRGGRRLPGPPFQAPRLGKMACVSPLALPIPHRVTKGRSPWPRHDKTRLLEPLRAGFLKGGRCSS